MVEASAAQGPVSVRPARPADAPVLTRIQIETIDWGELKNLGPAFFTLLHRHFITSRLALCYVAERDGEVIGYAAWSFDTRRFYRQFVLKYGVLAALLVLPRLLNPHNLRPLIRGLTYTRDAHPDDPAAEMLFFSVAPKGRHGGVGRALFTPMLAELRRRGVRRLLARTVSPHNTTAIRFYESLGFHKMREERFYSDTQIHPYILDIT